MRTNSSGRMVSRPVAKVRSSKFGQFLMKWWHACVIRSSRMFGNIAYLRLSAFEMGARQLAPKISNVFRLGSRTRQSTNFFIKSSGACEKYSSNGKGPAELMLVSYSQPQEKELYGLDVGSDCPGSRTDRRIQRTNFEPEPPLPVL
jgi:hypothetical protein